jgi:hypothetical protein
VDRIIRSDALVSSKAFIDADERMLGVFVTTPCPKGSLGRLGIGGDLGRLCKSDGVVRG